MNSAVLADQYWKQFGALRTADRVQQMVASMNAPAIKPMKIPGLEVGERIRSLLAPDILGLHQKSTASFLDRHASLQSSFASQQFLRQRALVESTTLANFAKSLDSSGDRWANLLGAESGLFAQRINQMIPPTLLTSSQRWPAGFDLRDSVIPRRVDDVEAYAASRRSEDLAELAQEPDLKLEAYEVELDPETRLFLAQSVPVDVQTFFSVFAVAKECLPDRPVSLSVAGGIGFVGMYMVRWGTEFVHRGGFKKRR